jgi:hypothetical protein
LDSRAIRQKIEGMYARADQAWQAHLESLRPHPRPAGLIDLEKRLQRRRRRIPRDLREPGSALGCPNSLAAYLSLTAAGSARPVPVEDLKTLLIGREEIAEGLQLTKRRLDSVLFNRPWLLRRGDLIATYPASRDAWWRDHQEETRATHLQNLSIVTDCSPGSSAR